MKFRRPRWLVGQLLAIWLVAALAARADDAPQPIDKPLKPLVPKLELADGDMLVFLGDSITHQSLYTQYIEDYFYTRFPKTRIKFHNAGVGGDRAVEALARFDRDVAAYKPKYVTVLLGMNDGAYAVLTKEIFGKYRDDMNTLIDKIVAAGGTPVLMTPTMYDSRAQLLRIRRDEKKKDEADQKARELSESTRRYNGTLAYFGSWLRELALEGGYGFVDMYSPLNNITCEMRKTEPNFTLIADAVHPDAPGQVIMAAAVLEELAPKQELSSISVVRGSGDEAKVQADGGQVSDAKFTPDGLAFTFAAEGLPLVVPEEAQLGAKLVHLGHLLSRESLDVHGLEPGNYKLLIDGTDVGTYSSTELEHGIELQDNPKTPQYQQGLAVAELNKKRTDEAVRLSRNKWGNMKNYEYLKQRAEKEPDNPRAQSDWASAQDTMANFDQLLVDLEAKAQEFEDQIYQRNQPPARKYELVRAK